MARVRWQAAWKTARISYSHPRAPSNGQGPPSGLDSETVPFGVVSWRPVLVADDVESPTVEIRMERDGEEGVGWALTRIRYRCRRG
jgi:hypothetical protein